MAALPPLSSAAFFFSTELLKLVLIYLRDQTRAAPARVGSSIGLQIVEKLCAADGFDQVCQLASKPRFVNECVCAAGAGIERAFQASRRRTSAPLWSQENAW